MNPSSFDSIAYSGDKSPVPKLVIDGHPVEKAIIKKEPNDGSFILPEELKTIMHLRPRNRVELDRWFLVARHWNQVINMWILHNCSLNLPPEQLEQTQQTLKTCKQVLNHRAIKLRAKRAQWVVWVEYLQCSYYPSRNIELNLNQFLALYNADFDDLTDELSNFDVKNVHMEKMLQLAGKGAHSTFTDFC